MKRSKTFLILAILSIIPNLLTVKGQIQSEVYRQSFRNYYIIDFKLKYTLPNGFIEPDSLAESSILPFKGKPAPYNRRHVNVSNQAFSKDGNIMIIWDLSHLTKQVETNARKIFPDTDVSKNYLFRLRGIVEANKGIRGSGLELDEQEIPYYGKKELRRLGAEVAGEYTIKLNDPYLDYNYLTFRFIVIPYYLDIYTYIFYKEYSDKIGQEVSRKTRYALRFRHPQTNR